MPWTRTRARSIATYLDEIRAALAEVAGFELAPDEVALFFDDPAHAQAMESWLGDPRRVTGPADAVGDWSWTSRAAGSCTARQLLAGGFDLRNTAARLGHSGGGATALRHYADPVPEVDRRAAAYLARLTAGRVLTMGNENGSGISLSLGAST